MKLRKVIFWLHLIAGATIGVVVLNMAVTGMILAFEPQIVDWFERDLRTASPPNLEARRLKVDDLIGKARESNMDARPNAVTIKSDPAASAVVNFGREGGTLYLNPYTGEVVGRGSKTNDVMHKIEEWHRWLWKKEVGQKITGAGCLAFMFLLLSGIYLWWPRKWNLNSLKAITLFNPKLAGRERNWNWHNVIGFWCAPMILVTMLTGVIMSYRWANDLLYRMTGNEPPPVRDAQRSPQNTDAESKEKMNEGERENTVEKKQGENKRREKKMESELSRSVKEPRPANLDLVLMRSEEKISGWVSINLRLPRRPGDPVTAVIEEPGSWGPKQRSQLTLDPVTAEIIKWEPYSGQNSGRKLRSWVKPVHTGEAFGIAGQAIAFVSASGAVALVYTGLAMAWRRFRKWKSRGKKTDGIPA